ncbi:MAG TPA: antitoxin [Micromonosporaceae bacterium]
MSMSDLVNRAKDLLRRHPDKVDNAVDQARVRADKATGSKYSEHLDTAAQQAKDALRRQGGQDRH